MSVVTSIILTTFLEEEAAIAHLNKELSSKFRDLSDAATGTKGMQMEVYLAAYNYFDCQKFLLALKSAPWRTKDSVQIFLCGEHQERFTEVSAPFAAGSLDRMYEAMGVLGPY